MHPICNPAGALFNYNNSNIYLSQNIFFTGQWQLDQAGAGSYMSQGGGGFSFLSAPSGSANAATSLYKLVGFEPNNFPLHYLFLIDQVLRVILYYSVIVVLQQMVE